MFIAFIPVIVHFLAFSSADGTNGSYNGAAFENGTCSHGMRDLQWSVVDCQKIRLPYGGNPVVPSAKGPFSPPNPLPSASNKTNPTKTKTYLESISAILKGTENGPHHLVASTDCQQCTSTFQTLHAASLELSPSDITSIMVSLCEKHFNLFDSSDCQSLYAGSASEGPYMAKLFANLSKEDTSALCFFKHNAGCKAPPVVKIKESDWFTEKPQAKAPELAGKTMGAVHMSDIHLDTRYVLKSADKCRGSRLDEGVTRWGTYGCDTPADLLLSGLSAIKSLVNGTSFSIFTGDIVNHDQDTEISEAFVKFEEQSVFDAFKAEMSQPVFASLGNHDSFPSMYANEDSSWNFEFLSSLWRRNGWLDAQAAQDVKTHFGAYSVTHQGLTIVSINTDFWYVNNIFNYANYTNPDPNEKAGQRVWIIGHVPSGDAGSALPNPTALFQSIVVRFSATIAAVFWGHTHLDSKMIYYDFTDGSLDNGLRDTSKVDYNKPLVVGWIGPSLTPMAYPDNANPAWSLYQVDTKSFEVMNAQVFSADISEASWEWKSLEGKWKKLYDAREVYDDGGKWSKQAPLNAAFWQQYLVDALDNEKVLTLYRGFETRGVPRQKSPAGPEVKCRIQAGTAQVAMACVHPQHAAGIAPNMR